MAEKFYVPLSLIALRLWMSATNHHDITHNKSSWHYAQQIIMTLRTTNHHDIMHNTALDNSWVIAAARVSCVS